VCTVTLISLHCNKTEDSTGADECRLVVYVDGVPQPEHTNSMNDAGGGDTWPLGLTYSFNSQVLVKLWDDDNPPIDPNDWLGDVDIPCVTTAGPTTATFKEDDANYDLVYSVDCRPDPIPEPEPVYYQYAVKVIQGKTDDFIPIGPGVYFTSVNVHNPWRHEVNYCVKLAVSGHNGERFSSRMATPSLARFPISRTRASGPTRSRSTTT